MFNAWNIFWASFGRLFTVVDIATSTLETAALQGQAEVDNWASVNDAGRADRLAKAMAKVEVKSK